MSVSFRCSPERNLLVLSSCLIQCDHVPKMLSAVSIPVDIWLCQHSVTAGSRHKALIRKSNSSQPAQSVSSPRQPATKSRPPHSSPASKLNATSLARSPSPSDAFVTQVEMLCGGLIIYAQLWGCMPKERWAWAGGYDVAISPTLLSGVILFTVGSCG